MVATRPMVSTGHPLATSSPDAADLAARFTTVRQRTLALCAPLSAEDHLVQPMPDASPAKWHLAHTTWFFERFVAPGEPFDPAFDFLFNSYYEAVGPRVDRARRGLLSRPPLDRIHAYRAAVEARVLRALAAGALDDAALARLELGLHHEQQHQELILTDLKYALGTQPLQPAYHALPRAPGAPPAPLAWHHEPGGIVELGATGDGFAFDNERPRHRVLLAPYRIATRPIANAEVLAFIAEGGYADHRLWLSDGWQLVNTCRWEAPLYWQHRDGAWLSYDLAGVRVVDPGQTCGHLSLYEADAIARWLGARLPSEAEWEHAARGAHRRAAGADVRRRLGVDVEQLLAVPGLPAARRRARRVQRQVHERPARAARRLVLHARRSHPSIVSQLLPPSRALADDWHAVGN